MLLVGDPETFVEASIGVLNATEDATRRHDRREAQAERQAEHEEPPMLATTIQRWWESIRGS
jgi:hypothetical protein